MMKLSDYTSNICRTVTLVMLCLLAWSAFSANPAWAGAGERQRTYSQFYEEQGWQPETASADFTQKLSKYQNTYGQSTKGNNTTVHKVLSAEFSQLLTWTNKGAGDDENSVRATSEYQIFVADVNKYQQDGKISFEDAEAFIAEASRIYAVALDRKQTWAKSEFRYDDARELRENLNDIGITQICSDRCLPRCYYKELQTCSFCGLFAVVFNTASSIALYSINTFSGSIVKVVIIGFGIWIALQILAFVSSPEVRDLKDLASSLITQGFMVMLVVAILQTNSVSFFNQALMPIYTTGQNLAQTIIKPSQTRMDKEAAKDSDRLSGVKSTNIAACRGQTGIVGPNEGALPKAMGDSIICTMTLIQNRVAQVKALASASICWSWHERWAIFIPQLNYLFIGVGLWAGAMLMLLAVPFMMVDAVFELTIAAALVPFAVGSFAFKITRKYAQKIWETFLNSMFKFIFVALTALMLVVAYQSIITNSIADLSDMMTQTSEAMVFGKLLQSLPWWSTHFLQLIFVCILTWSVLGEALSFAGSFAKSISNTAIGSSIGTMAASFTKSAATRILEPTADVAARKTGHAIKAVAIAPFHYSRRAFQHVKESRTQSKGTYNRATGEYEQDYKPSWYFRLFSKPSKRYLVQNADGSKSLRTERTRRTRHGEEAITTWSNDNFSIQTTVYKDKDGKVLYSKDKIQYNTSAAAKMFNQNGTVNDDFAGMMMERGAPGADKFNIALAKAAMGQRMPNMQAKILNGDYISQEAVYDKNGNFVGFVNKNRDGSKTMVSFKMGATDDRGHQQMITSLTHIDASGRGTRLTSDGIINQKSTFKTLDGSVDGEINTDTIRSHYRLGAHYDYLFQHSGKGKVSRAMDNSMFSAEEINQAKYDIYSTPNLQAESSMYEFEVYHP